MSALYDMTVYLSVTAAAILLIKAVFKTKLTARAHLLIWLSLLRKAVFAHSSGI